ncbi:NADH-quinone oxidoreductase subunit NuoH [Mobilicoccus caccae]|uniref:NADH-quinone oxidoreductase subunit H n=1 Tax=Mobilicoccus caccae TaxID=1859295 RepID=A0ABQ6ITL5_9MICO|nr:NADH-quinone oxidoreductase subunit NuoH [Mobilicoccus caccae]GMA40633.1 NADH-quinone oxidoreductase subunit H [Mobilicoccus caccae]
MTPVLALSGPVADFSQTPLWLSAVKALLVFVYLMLQVVVVIWFERRFVGFMQQRPGPNRFGPGGILQTLADGFKLAWKEVVRPKNSDPVLYMLAPMIAMGAAFVSFSVIPLGGMVNMFGYQTPLQVTDSPVAVIIVLAAAGVGAYGFVLAGWSSGSTYPLLGGLRSTAQVISYEIAMGLSLVAVFLFAGSMSTSTIVEAQRGLWFIVPAFFSFLVYIVCMVGETNRIPFDLAEGEGEIVGGYHTEYSGMWFGMFFVGEYVNMFTVSALASTLFLGGWHAPLPFLPDGGYWGLLWLTGKMWIFMWFFVWLRGTLPRTRYDQFMAFGWKFLIPVTLVWVLAVAFMHAARLGFFAVLGLSPIIATVIIVVVVAALALGAAMKWDSAQQAKRRPLEVPAEVDPYAGGYPVPPMPGQRLTEGARDTRVLTGTAERADVAQADPSESDTTGSGAEGTDAITDQEGNRG